MKIRYSLLGTNPVIEIRVFERGQISWPHNRHGHYRPNLFCNDFYSAYPILPKECRSCVPDIHPQSFVSSFSVSLMSRTLQEQRDRASCVAHQVAHRQIAPAIGLSSYATPHSTPACTETHGLGRDLP